MPNEEFEAWFKERYESPKYSLVGSIKDDLQEAFNARQPEIDGLKEEIALCHGTLETD